MIFMELNKMRALTTAAKIVRMIPECFSLALFVACLTNCVLCLGQDARDDAPVFMPVVEFNPLAGEFLRDALRGVFALLLVFVLFLFWFLFLFLFLFGDDGVVFI